MSKSRPKKMKFAGMILTRSQHRVVASLMSMTCTRFGLKLKKVKSEGQFWEAVEFISGIGKLPGEDFFTALNRVKAEVGALGIDGRRAMIAKVDAKAFCEKFNIVTNATVTFEQIQANARKHGQTLMAPGEKQRKSPSVSAKDEFYASWEWRTLRMQVLKEQGATCNCCGASKGDTDMAGKPVKIVVDHIKPLSKHWNLRLEKSNLQVLCDECNMGKGNWDETDFRPPAAPDEWVTDADGVDPLILQQLTIGTLQ